MGLTPSRFAALRSDFRILKGLAIVECAAGQRDAAKETLDRVRIGAGAKWTCLGDAMG